MHRERRRRVSGESLEVPDGLAAFGEQGEAAVAQVVEADGRQFCPP